MATKKVKCAFLIHLTDFWPMFAFYTPWKHQKICGFLVFSGGIKWEHWPKIGSVQCPTHVKTSQLHCNNYNVNS